VTLKTGVEKRKMQLCHQENKLHFRKQLSVWISNSVQYF